MPAKDCSNGTTKLNQILLLVIDGNQEYLKSFLLKKWVNIVLSADKKVFGITSHLCYN